VDAHHTTVACRVNVKLPLSHQWLHPKRLEPVTEGRALRLANRPLRRAHGQYGDVAILDDPSPKAVAPRNRDLAIQAGLLPVTGLEDGRPR
jgi:hypothetical protein